ncbi:hypothetical protein Agub_g9680 [Astrephomene gubernaculifera]|uniref:COX assembly mitochondrial protein n=1 Tax=Astrephomene gubernaculifera TaxID=47775 RepID=A0AAD3HP84_9CHLO|nr:hypothetical protein Agub_g9680 [Astrephomene gubernaculifera]
MHPALIPEKHPLCGKYMEALQQCRKDNPYQKFFGVCSEITWDLSTCLKKEKKIVREPRQKRYHERWAKKRQEDEERLQQLKQQREPGSNAEAASEAAGSPAS